MEGIPRIVYCWPGLAQLWLRGSWAGLALAIGFTALWNLALAASVVYRQWFDPEMLAIGWAAVVVLWGASLVVTIRWVRQGAGNGEIVRSDPLFREVQEQYLQGNWHRAEDLLNRLLAKNVKDIDALLMRATLKRHTGRLQEARDELDALGHFEASAKWREEIRREQLALDEALLDREEESKEEDLKEEGLKAA